MEQGSCLIDGQRVPIARPRVRQCGGKELPLGTYQLFQRVTPAEETVWSNLVRGLSRRDYKRVLQQFLEAYGLEKSTVSERFIEASRKRLEELMSRSLEHLQIWPCFWMEPFSKGSIWWSPSALMDSTRK